MSSCSYIHMLKTRERVVTPSAECDGPHRAAERAPAMMGARTVEALADTFRVLGDPTRVRILDALSSGELCVCDIASLVGISESAASHQLRLLRGMRLVRTFHAGWPFPIPGDELGDVEYAIDRAQWEADTAAGAGAS